MKVIARLSLAAFCLLGLSGCQEALETVFKEDVEGIATKRVEMTLTGGVNKADNETLQAGIFNWYGPGAKDHFEDAYDGYHDWLKAKNLFRQYTEFEIIGAELADKDDEFSEDVVVTVKIERRKLKILVPRKSTMSWYRRR